MQKYVNISIEQALMKYSKGNTSIACLRPTSNGRLAMYTLDELLKDAIFFELQTQNDDMVNRVVVRRSNEEIHQSIQDSQLETNGDVTAEGDSCLSNKRIRIDLGKMKALKDAGWTKKQVAEELKCSVPSVHKYWNKL